MPEHGGPRRANAIATSPWTLAFENTALQRSYEDLYTEQCLGVGDLCAALNSVCISLLVIFQAWHFAPTSAENDQPDGPYSSLLLLSSCLRVLPILYFCCLKAVARATGHTQRELHLRTRTRYFCLLRMLAVVVWLSMGAVLQRVHVSCATLVSVLAQVITSPVAQALLPLPFRLQAPLQLALALAAGHFALNPRTGVLHLLQLGARAADATKPSADGTNAIAATAAIATADGAGGCGRTQCASVLQTLLRVANASYRVAKAMSLYSVICYPPPLPPLTPPLPLGDKVTGTEAQVAASSAGTCVDVNGGTPLHSDELCEVRLACAVYFTLVAFVLPCWMAYRWERSSRSRFLRARGLCLSVQPCRWPYRYGHHHANGTGTVSDGVGDGMRVGVSSIEDSASLLSTLHWVLYSLLPALLLACNVWVAAHVYICKGL